VKSSRGAKKNSRKPAKRAAAKKRRTSRR
jgi:hypothetical protein